MTDKVVAHTPFKKRAKNQQHKKRLKININEITGHAHKNGMLQ
jgi:hypothetical protein